MHGRLAFPLLNLATSHTLKRYMCRNLPFHYRHQTMDWIIYVLNPINCGIIDL
jgi:hypothetical protein